MEEAVDLDAFVPPKVTITFEGQKIEVKPPEVATILRVAAFWQKTRLADVIEEQELKQAVDDLKAELVKCIPELQGKQLLYPQLAKLVELLTQMSLPPDSKELAERGIATKGDPKDLSE